MLGKRDILISGFALFSMFFGAGNLIFPPTLGYQMGDHWIAANLGFITTGVGLVMLAVIATAKTGGSIYDIGKNIGKPFAILFGTLVILSIGPGLAIPRTAATTHEVLEGALFPGLSPILTSVIFFGLVLFFVLSPGTIIDRLGAILTPALLLALCVIIFKAVLTPLGHPMHVNKPGVFGLSFEEGYQTMDAIAALVFTSVVIEGYHQKGLTNQTQIMKHTISSAIIAAIGLAFIYGGLLYMGATASGANLGEIKRVELLLYSAKTLLGQAGSVFLSLAMGLACLTTAIGLTTTVGTFFETLFHGKIPYKVLVILSCLFSGYFAIRGVDSIVAISAPILSALYPVAMVLVFVHLFTNHFQKRSTQIGAVFGAFLPAFFLLLSNFIGVNIMEEFENLFPIAIRTFVWIIPVIFLGILFTYLPIPELKKHQ